MKGAVRIYSLDYECDYECVLSTEKKWKSATFVESFAVFVSFSLSTLDHSCGCVFVVSFS